MPARCANNSPYGSCMRPQTRLRRKSKNLSHIESVVARPDKDRPSNAREPGKKQSKAVKEFSSDPMTAVPDPVPEYTLDKTSSSPQLTFPTSISTVERTSSSLSIQTATFKPLPPLLSMPPSRTGLSYATPHSTLSSATSSVPGRTSLGLAAKPSGYRHLSVAVIVILAIGSAAFLLAFLFAMKVYCRPRRRIHPTPSRPILDETMEDSELKVDSSPLFGCDGRQSLPGNNGLLTWTQYSQPAVRPGPIASQNKRGSQSTEAFSRGCPNPDVKTAYPFLGHGNGPAITPANSIQQVSSALTRVASRLSVTSTSRYANHIAKDVQVDRSAPLTADGHPVIERNASNVPRSVDDATGAKRNENNDSKSSQGLAYDGADILSPQICLASNAASEDALAPPAAARGGRSRVKSTYYATNGYPRISAAPPLPHVQSARTMTSAARSVAPQRTFPRSESRRSRDTRALTLALGLVSPEMPSLSSPQPTLCPDDSLSVVGDSQCQRRENNDNGNDRTQCCGRGILHSRTETHTALGNLMLMDYSSTSKSLASIRDRDGTAASLISVPVPPLRISDSMKKSYVSSDKPPRVPSPPTLPSLAQMALAHENPESFASYRSPTYSIYGLYQNDRKSKVGSSGY